MACFLPFRRAARSIPPLLSIHIRGGRSLVQWHHLGRRAARIRWRMKYRSIFHFAENIPHYFLLWPCSMGRCTFTYTSQILSERGDFFAAAPRHLTICNTIGIYIVYVIRNEFTNQRKLWPLPHVIPVKIIIVILRQCGQIARLDLGYVSCAC